VNSAAVPCVSPAGPFRPAVPARRRDAGARFSLRRLLLIWPSVFLLATLAHAAEVLPPAPANHFNDYAGVISPAVAQRLNAELAQFERNTSSQLVVAIYPHMQSDSSIEDYTVRVFQAWQVGRKGSNNGAVLFVFTQDHRLRIATGYGLEGVLPDALCRRIIANEITPRLRAGDFDAGLTAGVHALMAAAKGEYRGTGRTVREGQAQPGARAGVVGVVVFFIVVVLILRTVVGRGRSLLYDGMGRRGLWINPGGGNWGGGNWGGGGGGWSGGGGSFSGGGGSTGGGGASGSW
jgi:uncharacterized protein